MELKLDENTIELEKSTPNFTISGTFEGDIGSSFDENTAIIKKYLSRWSTSFDEAPGPVHNLKAKIEEIKVLLESDDKEKNSKENRKAWIVNYLEMFLEFKDLWEKFDTELLNEISDNLEIHSFINEEVLFIGNLKNYLFVDNGEIETFKTYISKDNNEVIDDINTDLYSSKILNELYNTYNGNKDSLSRLSHDLHERIDTQLSLYNNIPKKLKEIDNIKAENVVIKFSSDYSQVKSNYNENGKISVSLVGNQNTKLNEEAFPILEKSAKKWLMLRLMGQFDHLSKIMDTPLYKLLISLDDYKELGRKSLYNTSGVDPYISVETFEESLSNVNTIYVDNFTYFTKFKEVNHLMEFHPKIKETRQIFQKVIPKLKNVIKTELDNTLEGEKKASLKVMNLNEFVLDLYKLKKIKLLNLFSGNLDSENDETDSLKTKDVLDGTIDFKFLAERFPETALQYKKIFSLALQRKFKGVENTGDGFKNINCLSAKKTSNVEFNQYVSFEDISNGSHDIQIAFLKKDPLIKTHPEKYEREIYKEIVDIESTLKLNTFKSDNLTDEIIKRVKKHDNGEFSSSWITGNVDKYFESLIISSEQMSKLKEKFNLEHEFSIILDYNAFVYKYLAPEVIDVDKFAVRN
jgi:hypothetical protein